MQLLLPLPQLRQRRCAAALLAFQLFYGNRKGVAILLQGRIGDLLCGDPVGKLPDLLLQRGMGFGPLPDQAPQPLHLLGERFNQLAAGDFLLPKLLHPRRQLIVFL